MSGRTMKFGNAPAVSVDRIHELRGMLCAVEFGTRELLAYGKTWDEVLKMLRDTNNAGKKFYRYFVSISFQSKNIAGIDLSKENLPDR